jgi:hypothetical protein
MYFIGLDVHKKTISYCVKDAAGRVHQEGKIGSTRRTAKQTRFDDNLALAQRFAGFFDREFFDIAENEHHSQR